MPIAQNHLHRKNIPCPFNLNNIFGSGVNRLWLYLDLLVSNENIINIEKKKKKKEAYGTDHGPRYYQKYNKLM